MFKAPSVNVGNRSKGEKRAAFQMPKIEGVKPTLDRGRKIPNGTFLLKILQYKPDVTRSGDSYILGRFEVEGVVKQFETSYTDKKKKEEVEIPPLEVGQEVTHYHELGGEFLYGEKEWISLLMAVGLTEEEDRVAFQAAFFASEDGLSKEDAAEVRTAREAAQVFLWGDGDKVPAKRVYLHKDMPRTSFEAAEEEAEAVA